MGCQRVMDLLVVYVLPAHRKGAQRSSRGIAGTEQADAAAVVKLEVGEVLFKDGPQVLEAVLVVVEDALVVEVLHQPAASTGDRYPLGQHGAAEDDAPRPDRGRRVLDRHALLKQAAGNAVHQQAERGRVMAALRDGQRLKSIAD